MQDACGQMSLKTPAGLMCLFELCRVYCGRKQTHGCHSGLVSTAGKSLNTDAQPEAESQVRKLEELRLEKDVWLPLPCFLRAGGQGKTGYEGGNLSVCFAKLRGANCQESRSFLVTKPDQDPKRLNPWEARRVQREGAVVIVKWKKSPMPCLTPDIKKGKTQQQ